MIKRAALHIGVFFSSIFLLWILLSLSAAIPNERIYDNMLESSYYFAEREPFEWGERIRGTADNYADTILLNIAWNIHGDNPFLSCLDTAYYDGNDGVSDRGENWGLYRTIKGEPPNTDYSRYWHGSAAAVRLLSLFCTVDGMRKIGQAAVIILFAVSLALLLRAGQKFAAAALALSLLSVNVTSLYLSLEYQSVFIIAALAVIAFTLMEEKGDGALTLLSVAVGVSAAFFDFLTAETLTILLPLMTVFIIREQSGRGKGLKENLLLIGKILLSWGLSYILTFIVKWSAASIISGENKFIAALQSADERLSGDISEESMPLLQRICCALLSNLSAIFGGSGRIDAVNIVAGLLLTAAAAAAIYLPLRCRSVRRDITATAAIIGAVPLARFIILSNHSYLHSFFTYRALAVTVMAISAVIWFNIRPARLTISDKKKKSGNSRHIQSKKAT